METTPKYPVHTLSKALDVIEVLSKDTSNRGFGISELSKMLGIGKSTIHRILETLMQYKYVEKNTETSRYRLGWGIYSIGQCVPRQNQLFTVDNNLLIELNKTCGETVNLAILANREVVVTSKISASDGTNIYINTGDRETLYATALGKVLVSEMEPSMILSLVREPMDQLTPHTINSVAAFMKQLSQVKELGYAVDDEEYCIGLYCIAMPVRDYTNKIVAAISVSTPKNRINDAKKDLILHTLHTTCARFRLCWVIKGINLYRITIKRKGRFLLNRSVLFSIFSTF